MREGGNADIPRDFHCGKEVIAVGFGPCVSASCGGVGVWNQVVLLLFRASLVFTWDGTDGSDMEMTWMVD